MINIVDNRKIWFTFSALLVGASVLLLLFLRLNLGIDFTGGSLTDVRFTGEIPTTGDVRQTVESQINDKARVQPSESGEYLIRTRPLTEDEHQIILSTLDESYGDLVEERFDMVGPVISTELARKAFWSILSLLSLIVLYVAWAFRKVSEPVKSWKYGLLTIVAAAHDVVIPLGAFALLGYLLDYQVDAAFIAAILTILGYSINDTIVVFDRIRENLSNRSSADSFTDIVNQSIVQTFARSINTSITTLLALVAVYIFGGETTRQFALALIIGIISGAYSSIFLASPLLVAWEKWKK